MINFNVLTKFPSNYSFTNFKNSNNSIRSLNSDSISFTAKTNSSSHVIALTESSTQTFFPDYIELNLKLILGKISLPNSLNQGIKNLSDDKFVDLILVKITEDDKKPVSIDEARKMDDHQKTYLIKTNLKHSSKIAELKDYFTEQYINILKKDALSTIEKFSSEDKKQHALNKLANTQCCNAEDNESSLLNLLINYLSNTSKETEERPVQELTDLKQKGDVLNRLLKKCPIQDIACLIDSLRFKDDGMEKINDMSSGLARIFGSEKLPDFLNKHAKRVNSVSNESKPIIDFVIDELSLSKHQNKKLEKLNRYVNDPSYEHEKAEKALDHYKVWLVKKHIKTSDDIKKIVGILTGSTNKILSPLIMSELKDLRKFKDKQYNKLNTVIDDQGHTVVDFIIKRLQEENIITNYDTSTQTDKRLPNVQFTLLAQSLQQDKEHKATIVDVSTQDGLNHQNSLIYKVVDLALEAMSIGLANGIIS